MNILKGLCPEEVFYYFEEICSIPHGSGNTKKISDYCVEFAKSHALSYMQDELGNVIITKQAYMGYENAPTVILQGHLDMVCEKESGCGIDLKKDGLNLVHDGEYIYAEGTTLGGDDGIAVAYILALLASCDIPHPRIEAVFTVDEEIGMLGAEKLDVSSLRGRMLINVDSEEEGVILVSCAGGMTARCTLPVKYETIENTKFYIKAEGLIGGHSGTEIGKGRANSNILMGRILSMVNKKMDINIVSLSGGLKDNAIPRVTEVCVLADKKSDSILFDAIREIRSMVESEYGVSDPDIKISYSAGEYSKTDALNKASTESVISVLTSVPNGVQSMSEDIEGLVKTSLNFGILSLTGEEMKMGFSLRSSVEDEKYALYEELADVLSSHGGSCTYEGDYPAWEYKKDSYLRNVMTDVYREMYNSEVKTEAIHAGLECGILCGKIDGLDCVSCGPDIFDIHTTSERLSISSAARMWEYLKEVLKRIK